MRYQNLQTDCIDLDFLQFSSEEKQGNIELCSTEELVDITNDIRKKNGCTDLVSVENDNDVYYNFYLMFNTEKKSVGIIAVCNYGEKDDAVNYELPITEEEKVSVMWQLIQILSKELYNS